MNRRIIMLFPGAIGMVYGYSEEFKENTYPVPRFLLATSLFFTPLIAPAEFMVSKNNIAPISTALVISAYLCSLSFYIGNQTGRIVSQAVQNSWIHKSLTEM